MAEVARAGGRQGRYAHSGLLRRGAEGLALCLDEGAVLAVTAWPAAERHVGARVHVIGELASGPCLIASSITPLA